jgi:hypothetical protein
MSSRDTRSGLNSCSSRINSSSGTPTCSAAASRRRSCGAARSSCPTSVTLAKTKVVQSARAGGNDVAQQSEVDATAARDVKRLQLATGAPSRRL